MAVDLPPWMRWVGLLSLFGGLTLMVAAQLEQGASWRILVDEFTKLQFNRARWYDSKIGRWIP